MNFLLRKLKESGTMTCNCIAFNEEQLGKNIMLRFPGRAIMYMGDDVRPGPYWAVYAVDVPALVAAGYRIRLPPAGPSSGQLTT